MICPCAGRLKKWANLDVRLVAFSVMKERSMTPGAHLLISWLSSVNFVEDSRERRIITYAGISPDLDGLGLIVDRFLGNTTYYEDFHHYVGHCGIAAIIISIAAAGFAKMQKLKVFLLSLTVFHLHILCDVIGSKGSDGYQWPIYYLYPFDKSFGIIWQGQWELNAWQNSVIVVILLVTCFYVAQRRHYSFFEVFGSRFDEEVFKIYKKYLLKNNA